MEKLKDKSLTVKVFFSPTTGKEFSEVKAQSVSSKNRLGNFDILPGHTNFISLIFDNLTIQTPKEKVSYRFERGVLEVSEDKVNVFLGL